MARIRYQNGLIFLYFSNELGQTPSSGRTSSKQYWAKGTGFGTGSTSSGWDIEQALVKQKNEEEHITSILQVLHVPVQWGKVQH